MTVDQPIWHIKSTITPALVFCHWLLPPPGTFYQTPAMRPILIILLKIATASNSHSWILLACSNFPTVFLSLPPYNTLQNVLNCCAYCLLFHLTFYYQTNSVKPIYWRWGCGEEKCNIYCSRQARSPGRQLMLKSPKLPDGFQGSVFKGEVKERVTECVTNSTQFSALRGGSRVVSQVHIISPQAPVVWGICAYGHQAT